MKRLKKEEINDNIVLEIAKALKEGKLVIFPTDTVYAIGTNAYDSLACEKIYEAKGRPMYKPLTLLISNMSMLNRIVDYINPLEQKLIDNFWPGSLTIKFRKRMGALPDIVSAGDEYVRVRLVNDNIISKIIEEAGVPIVAPSANLSGSDTGTKIDNIVKELGEKVHYVLDFGDIEVDTVSTIVQVEDNKIVLIREGKIKKEDLIKIADIKE